MRTHTTIRPLAAALLAACALTVAACGEDGEGGGGTGTADRQSQAREAALKHAECMREHGVDMPDPQFDGGRVMQRGPDDENIPREKLEEAQKACEKYFEKLEPTEPPSEEEQQEFKEAALAHARCVREHGIENFPDPTFDENGGAQLRLDKSMGIDPDDTKFQEAQKACEGTLPDPEESSQ